MNIIQQIAQDIVSTILLQQMSKQQLQNISNKKQIVDNILLQCKTLQATISSIRGLLQVIKINIRKTNLIEYNNQKQYNRQIKKFVKQQKKVLKLLINKGTIVNNFNQKLQESLVNLQNKINNVQQPGNQQSD